MNLSDIIAGWKGVRGDVMSTLFHGVVEASASGAIVSTSHNTLSLEPGPWGENLTTIAAEGEALTSIAACSGVSNREKSGPRATSANAETIVHGLSGSVSPA